MRLRGTGVWAAIAGGVALWPCSHHPKPLRCSADFTSFQPTCLAKVSRRLQTPPPRTLRDFEPAPPAAVRAVSGDLCRAFYVPVASPTWLRHFHRVVHRCVAAHRHWGCAAARFAPAVCAPCRLGGAVLRPWRCGATTLSPSAHPQGCVDTMCTHRGPYGAAAPCTGTAQPLNRVTPLWLSRAHVVCVCVCVCLGCLPSHPCFISVILRAITVFTALLFVVVSILPHCNTAVCRGLFITLFAKLSLCSPPFVLCAMLQLARAAKVARVVRHCVCDCRHLCVGRCWKEGVDAVECVWRLFRQGWQGPDLQEGPADAVLPRRSAVPRRPYPPVLEAARCRSAARRRHVRRLLRRHPGVPDRRSAGARRQRLVRVVVWRCVGCLLLCVWVLRVDLRSHARCVYLFFFFFGFACVCAARISR